MTHEAETKLKTVRILLVEKKLAIMTDNPSPSVKWKMDV